MCSKKPWYKRTLIQSIFWTDRISSKCIKRMFQFVMWIVRYVIIVVPYPGLAWLHRSYFHAVLQCCFLRMDHTKYVWHFPKTHLQWTSQFYLFCFHCDTTKAFYGSLNVLWDWGRQGFEVWSALKVTRRGYLHGNRRIARFVRRRG